MIPPIAISAAIEAARLQVVLDNPSPSAQRVWSRRGSWGYSTCSLLVARSARPGEQRELTAKPVRWTVNFPEVIEIAPGERAIFDLAPGDPEWLGLAPLEPWLDEIWEVRVRLSIPDSQEARSNGVFIGELTSPPAISNPPHGWLRIAKDDATR